LVVLLVPAWNAQAQGAPPQSPEAAGPGGAVGSLEVIADEPGAEVLLDGIPVGVVPVRLEAVAVGEHQVQLLRLNSPPWTRTVRVGQGERVVLNLALPPATAGVAETPPQAPGGPATEAWREFATSVLAFPWAGLAVGSGVALLLGSVVLLTTNPEDMPFWLDNRVPVTTQQWRGLGVASLLAGAAACSVAVVILVLRAEPTGRFLAAVKAAVGGKEASH
jgi:hypothetical protein